MATAGDGDGERKRIALMGTTGTGKSSLANALLGFSTDCDSQDGFRMGAGVDGCTTHVEARNGYLLGDGKRRIRVIDTPGASDGSLDNDELRSNLVEGLKPEKAIHAFLWVKNSSSPRFDEQDRQFFEIFSKMFGKGFAKNLIVVFTRFSYSDEAEKNRKEKQGASLKATIEGFRNKIKDRDGKMPMLAIDAHYNPNSQKESRYFHAACEELWDLIERLGAEPVEHVEVIRGKRNEQQEKIKELTDLIERMRLERARDRNEWKKQLEEAQAKYAELESKLKSDWPDWFQAFAKNVFPVVDKAVKGLASYLEDLWK